MSTTALSNAAFAVLSLVNECPRHGYEIEAVIADRGMREWTHIGMSSIYYLLQKLKAQGLVATTTAPVGARPGPARKIFTTTEAGRSACRAATRSALSAPAAPRSPLYLGLANLPGLSPTEAADALADRRCALVDARTQTTARRDAQRPMPPFVEAMFSHSLALIDAELAWLDGVTPTLTRPEARDDAPED